MTLWSVRDAKLNRHEFGRHLRERATGRSELDGGRPKSSVSHHFRVLRDAGLVYTENVGTTHMNHLRSEDMQTRFPGLLDVILSQRL